MTYSERANPYSTRRATHHHQLSDLASNLPPTSHSRAPLPHCHPSHPHPSTRGSIPRNTRGDNLIHTPIPTPPPHWQRPWGRHSKPPPLPPRPGTPRRRPSRCALLIHLSQQILAPEPVGLPGHKEAERRSTPARASFPAPVPRALPRPPHASYALGMPQHSAPQARASPQ